MQQIRRDAGDAFANEVRDQLLRGLQIVESTPTRVRLAPPPPPSRGNRGRWWSRLPLPRRRQGSVEILMLAPEITEVLPSSPAFTPYGASISPPSEGLRRTGPRHAR